MPTKLLISLMILPVVFASPCTDPASYSPCTCDRDTNGNINIECIQVSVQDIQSVMSNTITPNVSTLSLYLTSSTEMLPADLLSGRRVATIYIYCSSSASVPLKIDVDALRSSENATKSFYLTYCDLINIDYAFLRDFHVLDHLGLYSSSNVRSIGSLPALPNLAELYIRGSSGFENVQFPAKSLPALKHFYLEENRSLNDSQLNPILDAIASADDATLETLSLKNNLLTSIPEQTTRMPKISVLILEGNNVNVIKKNSVSAIKELWMNRIALDAIEPGAFQGDYSDSQVNLDNNHLTMMDENVFKEMLDHMTQSGAGSLSIRYNPIACNCSIAWLIRENSHLMKAIKGGTCSNYTSFEMLDPEGFRECDVIVTEPPSSSTTLETGSASHISYGHQTKLILFISYVIISFIKF